MKIDVVKKIWIVFLLFGFITSAFGNGKLATLFTDRNC